MPSWDEFKYKITNGHGHGKNKVIHRFEGNVRSNQRHQNFTVIAKPFATKERGLSLFHERTHSGNVNTKATIFTKVRRSGSRFDEPGTISRKNLFKLEEYEPGDSRVLTYL